MVEGKSSNLYFYEFCDFEGSFWAYSETKYTNEELESIVRPRANKYEAEQGAYREVEQKLWQQKENGEITEEEFERQDDILSEGHPCMSRYGLREYLSEHYNMVVLEHDAKASASMGIW